MIYYNNIFFQSLDALESYLLAREIFPCISAILHVGYISNDSSEKLLIDVLEIFESLNSSEEDNFDIENGWEEFRKKFF